MSLDSISSYLLSKVKSVSGLDQRYVYDYESPSFTGYPSVSITMKEWKADWLTNLQNRTTYIFTVRIYIESTKHANGPSRAESELRQVADSLIASFNSDNRLGNNVVYTRPIAGRSGFVPDQPIRVYEIDIECTDVISSVG